MKQFKKILVGVDLSQGDRLVSDQPTATTLAAVERGLWLAEHNGASVLFVAVLHVSPQTQHLIEEQTSTERNVLDDARDAIAKLQAQAEARGVRAESRVLFGKPAVEMVRQVLREAYDLVVVGTRDQGRVRRALIGSTASRLLRKCPCPVWVTKPHDGQRIQSVLVADDLTEVGQTALELGTSMAELHDAELHVLHAVDLPEEQRIIHRQIPAEEIEQLCDEARRAVDARLAAFASTRAPKIHVVHAEADLAILEHIDQFNVELLVMGTLAPTGIAGILVGNTAERLLPEIPCSVLAVKPAEFKSPIHA